MRRVTRRTLLGSIVFGLVCVLIFAVVNHNGQFSSGRTRTRMLGEPCNCPESSQTETKKSIDSKTVEKAAEPLLIIPPKTCQPVDKKSPVQRAILIYYPHHQNEHFFPEVRWLYRSWKEMLLGQPKHWRTDFIVFSYNFSEEFHRLGCVNHRRLDRVEESTCRLFIYVPVRMRDKNMSQSGFKHAFDDAKRVVASYNSKINASFVGVPYTWDKETFDQARSQELYKHLRSYEYIDSINSIFEGYRTFKTYDFILRTDIDVFIYRHFATYIPKNCSFITGGGGYGTHFNRRKLGRIARDMGFAHANISGMGSTWYGSPYDAYLVANQTLHGMLWLALYEFATPERESKLGTLMWPEWHYGVLLLYGQHLGLNHLEGTKQISVHIGHDLLDQSSTDNTVAYVKKGTRLNLHCWHTDDRFSKFYFKANRYNDSELVQYVNDTTARAYAMRMALESKKMTLEELAAYGRNRTNTRT